MVSYKLIYNPVSKDGLIKKYRENVESVLKEYNADYSLAPTEKPRHAIELAMQAKDEGYTYNVAFGGDGTANEVLNGSVRVGIPVGFLPFGSGNDLAGGLGYYPNNIEYAIRTLLDHQVTSIPALQVNNYYSFNILDIGLSSVISQMALKRFRWIHGRKKYTFLAFRTIPFYKNPLTKIIIDGEEHNVRLVLTAMGHGQSFGSGMNVLPTARFGHDKFTICFIKDMGIISKFKSFDQLTKGTHVNLKETECYQASQVIISSEKPLPIEAEGEIIGQLHHEPVTITRVPNVAKVLTPKDWHPHAISRMVEHLHV